MKLKLIVPPNETTPDGYYNSTRDLINEFNRQGVEVTTSLFDEADYTLVYGHPTRASKLPADEPFGVFTMFESTKPPTAWKTYLEKADFIANPTAWGAKTFHQKYGLEPIYNVNLAYSKRDFKYIKRYPRPNYTFLSYNNGFNAKRKGFFELIKAFEMAFRPQDNVQLIIKDFKELSPNQEFLLGGLNNNVEYITGNYSREQLMGLLSMSDCFVFPSRGEGWGHTPLEAMATGIPVIVPNKHGISEYYKEPYCIGYDTHEVTAEYDSFPEDDYGVQYKANVESLAEAMYETYHSRVKYQEESHEIAAYAKEYEYFWTVKKLIKLINDHRSNPNV